MSCASSGCDREHGNPFIGVFVGIAWPFTLEHSNLLHFAFCCKYLMVGWSHGHGDFSSA